MITIKSLDKTYNIKKPNAFKALNDISLEIKEGELVAVMGPSGAGKSTLLHILGTLDDFEKGEYYFDGKLINRMSDKKLSNLRAREIGFVLQDFGLISEEAAASNAATPLFFDNTPMRKINKKAREALKIVGIEELAEKKVKNLSGGQKQRVAIARAIVNDPKLILADEPTGSLDSENSDEIMKIFEQLNSEGRTIVIVTHNEEIAKRCNRIITISDGRIVEDSAGKVV